MNDIEQKIIITTETNADETAKKVDTLVTATDNTVEAQKKSTKSTKEQQEALGQLSPALDGAIQGIKATGKALWVLVANPIVAVLALIVGGLALLFKAFTSTNDGADKFDQVMAGISATIDVVRDRILKVGDAIVKFFSGDFKGALATGFEAVSGFGAEVSKEFEQAAKATEALQEVEDAMRELGVSRAKLNRDLAESKEIITDETASYAEKKKAIEEVRKAETLQTEQELANARKKLKAIQDLNAQSDVSDENMQKEADARAALYGLEEKSASDRRSIRKTEARADKEEQARLKELSDARKAINKERLDAEKKIVTDVQNLQDKTEEAKLARQKARDIAELKALEQKGIDIRKLLTLNDEKYNILEDELKAKRAKELKDSEDATFAELQSVQDKINADRSAKEAEEGAIRLASAKNFSDEQIKIAQAEAEQKRRNTDDILATGDALVMGAKMLAGKNKALQKAAIITEGAVSLGKVGVNIATGVSKDASTGAVASVPQIIKTLATGAVSTASIIANTSKALSAIGGGGGGSIGGGANVQGGGAVPQVQFQNSSENQIANSVNQAQQNLQVTVLESEISNAQNNVKVLVNENSF